MSDSVERRQCSHGPGCTLPWSVHDWSYEAERRFSPCPYAEMDWYCALPIGHDGPHRSEDLS